MLKKIDKLNQTNYSIPKFGFDKAENGPSIKFGLPTLRPTPGTDPTPPQPPSPPRALCRRNSYEHCVAPGVGNLGAHANLKPRSYLTTVALNLSPRTNESYRILNCTQNTPRMATCDKKSSEFSERMPEERGLRTFVLCAGRRTIKSVKFDCRFVPLTGESTRGRRRRRVDELVDSRPASAESLSIERTIG